MPFTDYSGERAGSCRCYFFLLPFAVAHFAGSVRSGNARETLDPNRGFVPGTWMLGPAKMVVKLFTITWPIGIGERAAVRYG